MQTFIETLYNGYTQGMRVEKIYFEKNTEHQRLMIFHNAVFGRVMALDGIIQTTESDEFIYHEMLAHVPILAHGNAKRVLVVGGGDGAILREVIKHRSLEAIIQIEIDRSVIELSQEYLPKHSAGAFDDPRVSVIIEDGMVFVRDTPNQFDIIISDSTDPIGPGEALFTRDFYSACHRCLKPGGVFIAQNGVVFLQPDEVENSARYLSDIFNDWHFYSAAVPSYVGGVMAFAWASDDLEKRFVKLEILEERYRVSDIRTRYYTPEIHRASFALPKYIMTLIGKH